MQKLGILNYLLLFSLALCWGPSYLFIKLALESFHPLMLSFLRIGLASVFLFIFCKLAGYKVTQYLKQARHLIFIALFINAFPFTLINFAEQKIASSLTAIILGMIPVFTAILSHLMTDSEKLSKRTLFGIFLGFFGLVIVYLPKFVDKKISNETGLFLVILAAFCYALATTYAKIKITDTPPLVCTFYQTFFASIALLPFALSLPNPVISPITTISWISLLCLSLFGTSLAFFIYYKSIKISGATFTSLNSLLAPLVSVFLGTIILKEQLTPTTIFGAILILLGVFKINPFFARKN